MQGDEHCLDARTGEAAQKPPHSQESQKGCKLEMPGSLETGLAAGRHGSPPTCAARGPPSPPQRRQQLYSLQKVNQRLAGADGSLLTEKVGNRRKSAHGISRPQTAACCTHGTCTTGRAWGHHQGEHPSTSPTPNTQFHSYALNCV